MKLVTDLLFSIVAGVILLYPAVALNLMIGGKISLIEALIWPTYIKHMLRNKNLSDEQLALVAREKVRLLLHR